MKRIIVVGGLSAGPSAAAKARREDENAEILLFEKSTNISYATCGIPYALSGVIESRDKLIVVEANLLRDRFKIDVRLGEEVIDIDPTDNTILTSKGMYSYDKLIFATGARPNIPPIKNIEKTTNWSTCRSLKDFDKIMKEGLLDKVKKVTILGAGLIGVEVAENIAALGKDVTIIEGNTRILPMWEPKFSGFAQAELERKGIRIVTGQFANNFVESKGIISQIELTNESIDTDFVIVSTGIKPNTEMLVQKGAKTIGNGALLVNEKMETSLPNIYAAGDNASIINFQTGQHDYFPLGTHSNKGGRTAGANAVGGSETIAGGYGTAIIKIFDFTLARTGLNKTKLDALGINYKTNLIMTGTTPGYYPGQTDIIVEMYYNPDDGSILGAEMYGEKGVDKRIDVISTAIYANLKMSDLPKLDLAYAPPYAPAKDPVIVNGFVNSNTTNGNYTEISVEELKEKLKNSSTEFQLIDVRTVSEYETLGSIITATNIDLDELRSSLDQLDRNKETIVYCARGLRGYLASRILQNYGFSKVKNLAGGFKVWEMYDVKKEFTTTLKLSSVYA